jgi:hypothetical protein
MGGPVIYVIISQAGHHVMCTFLFERFYFTRLFPNNLSNNIIIYHLAIFIHFFGQNFSSF